MRFLRFSGSDSSDYSGYRPSGRGCTSSSDPSRAWKQGCSCRRRPAGMGVETSAVSQETVSVVGDGQPFLEGCAMLRHASIKS